MSAPDPAESFDIALALIDIATEGKPEMRANIRKHLEIYILALAGATSDEDWEIEFSLDDSN